MTRQISIIIPTLNEAESISSLLNHLIKNSSKEHIAEIIIVDGRSTDDTFKKVQKFISSSSYEHSEKLYFDKTQQNYREDSTQVLDTKFSVENFTRTGIIFLESDKGRAKQMNLGAKNAKGSILYFLHADSFPPKNFDKYIINEVKKGNEAGCFRMRFNSSHWWLKLAGILTALPWKSCRGGDQSLFITQQLFKNIGGYNENYVIYEDNVLINKLYNRNEFTIIPKWLTTSARRYKSNGIWTLQFHFWTIHLKKWFGASPEKLNQYYLKHVSVKK